MQEGLRQAEKFGYAWGEVVGTDKLVGGGMEQAIGFEAEVFRVLRLLLKALGVALQGAFAVEHEGGSYGADNIVKVATATDDIFAQDLQHLGVATVVARGQHVAVGIAFATRTNVEVVARVARLLTTWTDEGAHVGLVGTLVGTEAHIAIDAVGAVLGREARDRTIETAYLVDEFVHKGVELCLQGGVAVFIGHEPLAIVVDLQLAQEGDDCFHGAKIGKKAQ